LRAASAAEPAKAKAKTSSPAKAKHAVAAEPARSDAGVEAVANRPLLKMAARSDAGLTGVSLMADLKPLMHEEAKAKIAQDRLDPPDALPLTLWLNFPRALVAGYGSIVEVKIENVGAGSLQHLGVVFESKGLAGAAEIVFRQLGPAKGARQTIEVTPTQAGNFILRCNLKSRRSADAAGFRGSVPITINVAPDSSNLVVNINDIQCVRGGGANPGAEEFGAVNISNLLPPGAVRTLNDLLNVSFPESFGQVPLERDYEVTGSIIDVVEDQADTPWSIPEPFLTQAETGTKLKLEPADVAAGRTVAAIHLVARNEFRLGRSRALSDFLTWFWPRSPENDDRTKRLSKVHVIAESSEQRLVLRDAGSANRSTFEGQPLSENENDVLDQRGTLILGLEYHLDVTPFESTFTGNLQVSNIRKWSGPPEKEKPNVLGAVRFMPINSELALHNAVWMFSDAHFGCSRLNAVVLDLPGAAEIEGRFSYFRKNFWIETLPTGTGVQVGGHQLSPLELVPIVTGTEIVIAGQMYRATVEP
jgi:hypothetical protein